jgi:ABC-type iron transport system FetAB ATPase subunit
VSSLRIEHLQRAGVSAADITIAAGSCIALHGASGSGKTLLLRAIADLDEAEGEVWLDQQPRSGMSGPQWRRRVSYVAAESHWWSRWVREHAKAWRTPDLQTLGFGPEVLDWEVQRLSSGERQRLAIARVLAGSPAVLLLDEPTANLDQENARRVERLIEAWRRDTGGCVVWVSHDPAQRARVAKTQFEILDGNVRQEDGD